MIKNPPNDSPPTTHPDPALIKTLKLAIYAISSSMNKLAIYRGATNGEYQGGIEYIVLKKRNEAAIEAIEAALGGLTGCLDAMDALPTQNEGSTPSPSTTHPDPQPPTGQAGDLPVDSETAGAWPENVVAQRHEVSCKWCLMYLDDQQAALCQKALQRQPKQEAVTLSDSHGD